MLSKHLDEKPHILGEVSNILQRRYYYPENDIVTEILQNDADIANCECAAVRKYANFVDLENCYKITKQAVKNEFVRAKN